MKKILVTGAAGAIGRNLLPVLYKAHGDEAVIAGYNETPLAGLPKGCKAVQLDVTDKEKMRAIIEDYKLQGGEIYHLAALLSIAAEKNPGLARKVNINGLINVFELAKDYDIKVFWPSSIAVFGSSAPKNNTPQDAALDPEFEYGRNKVHGEQILQQFIEEFGVDARSVRYPGLIGPGKPGPGTTEYSIEMIYAAVGGEPYIAPLRKDTALPMMDMRDATWAALEIMAAPKKQIRIHSSYNLSSVSFTPQQLADEIRKHFPSFKISYKPDPLKQKVADSWPDSIDDKPADKDWGWKPSFGLTEIVKHMITEVKKEITIKT